MNPAEAWHACHILKLQASVAAKRLGVSTSEYWSMVAAHNIIVERRRDKKAAAAPAVPESAVAHVKAVEAENVIWRRAREAELRASGLEPSAIDERLRGLSRWHHNPDHSENQ